MGFEINKTINFIIKSPLNRYQCEVLKVACGYPYEKATQIDDWELPSVKGAEVEDHL